ncbi:23S rRNA (pseudouridine(1915)-N(3))-methyltransferase RlmH [Candidatus Peregrinibacteria bacterium]|jgi:23S rRNA (pseudouridine1915-N3)-methyltransferase|nr:23S rRNA (pseudouridine(1915)-N(3))-methyltransferase RlmH [Candidatus Peregrinibacteria bacterium]MBT5468388.1 23S rRNA (pseudouridine(1915)-N(3))-methyltransferase RlmH [Candidatus Peregrinibacteria bacterium]MBT7337479.1 23S rRNA (pseudouridine(1915)-N(3))-methyltransferase RlmH [Candidatus Peregrinibacteria bacterium]
MNKITLLAVGSVKTAWAKEGCEQYLGRIDIDVIEVPASKQKDEVKQKQEDSDALLKKLEKMKGEVWVLDETGTQMTSLTFAKTLEQCRDCSVPLIFVLGGAFGLTDEVRSRGEKLLRLSDMVLPHELCRVVFLEQLYRAHQIQKGTGYHH